MIPASVPPLSIVMPAYNAATTIGNVVGRISDAAWEVIRHVWIVDDGSTDDTAAVIGRLAHTRGAVRAIGFDRNRGYGAAVREGLARCRADGCEVAICLHSDGQYPPEEVLHFAETMTERFFDILQGSRIASGTALSGGMPLYKYAANRALTKTANVVLGMGLSDYYSGMLAYSRRALERIPFERFSPGFDFDLEVIASANRLGLRVGELPIPTHYGGERSYLNPITYGFRVLRVLGRYALGGYRA